MKQAIRENKLLFIRFIASLALTAALFSVVFSLNVIAADTEPFVPAPDVNINTSPEAVDAANPDAVLAPSETSVLMDLIGVDASQPLEIILLLTVISIAPSILLMMTCFTRIVIVMSFLRNAMQTQQTPPNQVIVSLALFLTMFLMWPVFVQINQEAYRPYADGEITTWEAVERAGGPLKTFMLKQTTRSNMAFFLDLANATIYTSDTFGTDNQIEVNVNTTDSDLDEFYEQIGFEVVIPAFMVSELSRAFQMGFMLFVPFLIIDIVVASTLMSMGMMMLPPAMISMPFKLMLFVLVDGWQMLVGSIAASFNL
ncbi:MAG: flagellar type III secretion system pore protein FliP [Oscillospiraceae bacterium]|jgi:flagellar biosynthetic protein FliP|nr:flagellar type III secretion system pore protein FliP [Oscillospiraceae bacterium]